MLIPILAFQLVQAPSPMVENTRAHERILRLNLAGERIQTKLGSILLPERAGGRKLPLVIHFHGEPWLAEQSVRKAMPKAAVLAVQLGSGSRVYGEGVRDPEMLASVLNAAGGRQFGPIYLSGFSAGYGAIRQLLRQPRNAALVDGVILLDGLHSDYEPPAEARRPLAADLDVFLEYARLATAGQKRMLVLHSEVFPGTFASTTETTDWMLAQLGLKQKAILKWGPLGMQMLSETRAGRLRVLGFAGNSAPDHVDYLHALGWALKQLK
ncbi:hypothetical protein [Paludibaculum fermentans]|uniref:hypothetical protein n=1 Tax=Paludibaculum fermentans TaxID=1473598 RepID=UPI003EB960A8